MAAGDPRRLDKDLLRVHLVAAQPKRWLLGLHQDAMRKRHLNCCLDEFILRFNRRTSRSRGLLSYRLSQQAVVTALTLQPAIIAPARSRPAASGAPSE